MFRVGAPANPFDEVVSTFLHVPRGWHKQANGELMQYPDKATDENLTSENWEYILDVCDRVSASETGGKDAVAALIKRLAHRNANVQLYTLELANALSQNCGIKIHKELASRSFTDALLRLASDRVKTKILERMAEWTEMFSKDPDLGIMEQGYQRLKSQNPSLQPPSKPVKHQISALDRQKEDEELQMALALSIKDKQPADQSSSSAAAAAVSSRDDTAPTEPAPSGPVPSGTTAATVSRVRALYDFVPSEPGELQFRKGDIITVLESVYKDWWKGSLRGQTGIFPLNYVEKLQDPTEDELRREAQMEAEVFKEIRHVEKLLTLLSTSSSGDAARDNEEITTLYHQTLSIRPKLIELIGKYSQKKDEFTQLNERFIKSRRDYEALLEQSMAQPQTPYARPPPSNRFNAYNGPPPQDPYGHQPQSQQDPSRFYSGQQAQQQPYPPPQNGPAPFYMIPPGSAPPPAPDQGRPSSPTGHIAQLPDRKSGASFQSAQELAAGGYDTPADQQRRSQAYHQSGQPQGQSMYPPAGADLYDAGGGVVAPQQPSYAPPGVPHAAGPPPLNPQGTGASATGGGYQAGGYPQGPSGGSYPSLAGSVHEQQQQLPGGGGSGGGGGGQYHAYQPPSGGYGPVMRAPGAAPAGADGEDFYR